MVDKIDLRTNDTRKRIIEEAKRLFEAGGYNELSMEKIAEILGLKRPTLYYHFPGGKEQLAVETIKIMIDQQTTAWKSAIEIGPDTRTRLRNILDSIIEIPLIGNERSLLAELWQHGEELKNIVIEGSRKVFKMLSEIFEQGIASGEIRPVNVELAAYSYFGLCDLVKNLMTVKENFAEVIPFAQNFEPKPLVDNLFEMWLVGLENQTPSSNQ